MTVVARPRWTGQGAAAAAVVVVLAGCAGSPMELSDMRAAVEAELVADAADGTARAAVPLTDGFVAALREAVVVNERYRAAEAREREAAQRIGVAASALRPALSGDASLGALREIGGGSATDTGASGGLTLSQLVYDGGGAEAVVNRSTAEAVAAIADRMAVANDVALNAARAWTDVWQYSERLRLLRERTEEMDELVGQIERLASTGVVDRAALDGALRQIVDVSIEERRLESDQSDAEARFARFFNTQPSNVGQPPDVLNVASARRLAETWRRAPDLQREAAQLLAAQAAVVEARSAFRPRVRLQAGARAPLERGETTDLTAGLTLEYNFSDGGRRQRELEAAEERAEAQQLRLEDIQRSLAVELEAAAARLGSIERSLPLVTRKIDLSRSEADTARSQIMTGQSTVRQLVEAEIEVYRASDQRVALLAERQMLLLTVAARTGELDGLILLVD